MLAYSINQAELELLAICYKKNSKEKFEKLKTNFVKIKKR